MAGVLTALACLLVWFALVSPDEAGRLTPIAFVASSAQVNVLNDDGSARTQKVITNGVVTSTPAV